MLLSASERAMRLFFAWVLRTLIRWLVGSALAMRMVGRVAEHVQEMHMYLLSASSPEQSSALAADEHEDEQPQEAASPATAATQPGCAALPVAMLHEFKEISRCTSVEGIFARVRAAVLRLLPVQRATMLLVDEGAGELRVIMSSDANSVAVPLGQGIAGAVVASRQTIVVPDAYADPRFDRSVDELTGYSTRSIVAVPIFNHDETRVVAVLQALNKSDGLVPFDESDVVLLEVLAAHCSGLVARTALFETGLHHASRRRPPALPTPLLRSSLRQPRLISRGLGPSPPQLERPL